MLDMAKVTPKDYVIDLGSGDGRTVITAAKRGAKALGIEYNPDMVELSKRSAAKDGVADNPTINNTGPIKPPARIAPASHGASSRLSGASLEPASLSREHQSQ